MIKNDPTFKESNAPNSHNNGSKSLWIILGVPGVQGDLLQV